jgi:hypothetical protein
MQSQQAGHSALALSSKVYVLRETVSFWKSACQVFFRFLEISNYRFGLQELSFGGRDLTDSLLACIAIWISKNHCKNACEISSAEYQAFPAHSQ